LEQIVKINLMQPFKFTLSLLSIAAILMLSACGSTETKIININSLVLVAEGPLFEGSNTATANWENELKDLNVKSAQINSLKIWAEPQDDMPEIGEIVMEIAAPQTDMFRLGFIKSFNYQEENALSLAEDQKKLAAFFKQSTLTFVADIDLPEDYFDDLILKMSAEISLEVSE
jgi:hypothetical protein